MQITAVEGFPYPGSNDFAALPVHMQNFANAFDAKVPAWDAAFTSIIKQPCFIMRMAADMSPVTFGSGLQNLVWGTTIFNNTGGIMSGNIFFIPNANDLPAWWLFGCYLFVVNAGTTTALRANQAILQPQWSGYGTASIPGPQPAQISAVLYPTPTGAVYGESIETNQGGEPVQAQGIFRTFGSFSVNVLYTHNDNGAAATRTVKAGSNFWGIRLGNA